MLSTLGLLEVAAGEVVSTVNPLSQWDEKAGILWRRQCSTFSSTLGLV